ncbi:cation:proton antiporter domain-containing protein [Streptomyces sp. SD15]
MRVPLPGPVLEIVAGVIVGPAVLNLVQPDATVQALSIIGLSFLLFLAGLEIDFQQLHGPRARLVAIGLAGRIVLAAIVGWFAGLRRAGREPTADRHRAGGNVLGAFGPDPEGRRRNRPGQPAN